MANPEHLAKLKEGNGAWNRWREKNSSLLPDLSKANLRDINLFGEKLRVVNLREADLAGANLREADLEAADLQAAYLFRADLARTNLVDADLIGADLSDANLTGAHLDRANLFEANLCGANLCWTHLDQTRLTDAYVGNTVFAELDLSGVVGLDLINHIGPSSLGIDTIYKSKGKIPHIFLRGAGVPDNFIEYMASLVGTGIEFYSLFISYSDHGDDKLFAERLHADLQAKGVRCWFAPHDMHGGKKVHEQIDEAIRVYDKLLLILSSASMESEWVKTEISKARKREIKEGKRILFPIRLCSFEALRDWECFDADTGKDSAREIREFHIPDFSNWKDHDSYRLAFDRLLKDLQGKPEPPSA
jgi:hypothetical protein